MTDSQPEPFTSGLTILDGGKEYPLPDWASSLLWLGQWCRNHRDPLNRLVTFVVLPTRDFAAVFAGIGAIVGGAKLFEDKLSWPIFRELSVGTSVYWQKVGGGPKFAGTILGFSDMYGSEFISVEVTKPASSATPACISISKQNFETYAFRLERPPTSARFISLNNASQFIGGLCDGINPKWINADGAEGLIVTNMENFQESFSGLSLRSIKLGTCGVADLLCLSRSGSQSHAKLRLSHSKGDISGRFPLVILDGPEAFEVHEHLEDAPNLLVILARSEYTTGIDDRVRQLRNVANEFVPADLKSIPNQFPHGFEIGTYSVRRS